MPILLTGLLLWLGLCFFRAMGEGLPAALVSAPPGSAPTLPISVDLRPAFSKWANGDLEMCPANAVFDGHSVLLVGCRDEASQPGGGVFLFRKTAIGGRDGNMHFAYAQASLNDAIWIDLDPLMRPASRTAAESASRTRSK